MSSKYCSVTKEMVAREISYNRETGELTTLKPRIGLSAGDAIPAGQRVIDLLGISTTPTKLAWLLETGAWPRGRVAKIDPGAGLEFGNLRDCGATKPVKKSRPELTVERLREVLDYCPATGIFHWAKPLSSNVRRGDVAGCISEKDGYLKIRIDGTLHLAHRLAMFYIYQRWPEQAVDHKNGIKSDNRIENLRCASKQQNAQNTRRGWSHGSSGLLGAHFSKTRGTWTSAIKAGSQVRRLGEFASAQDAHDAYVEAKRQMHEFSML